MSYANCVKCGAIHGKTSKHKPTITNDGLAWCGHCGNRLHLKNIILSQDAFKNGIPKGKIVAFTGYSHVY